jgi:hypothetical protein
VTPELDHFFIWTSVGAPEADCLVKFGLNEGTPNTHPGQGTSCRRFFFRNAYLELLWIHDSAEAQADAVRPLHFWERWSGRANGACPFGFIFRPATQPNGALAFATWEYRPPYLPAPLSFQVATNANVLTEPMLFLLPPAQRPDNSPARQRPAPEHAVGVSEVSRIEMIAPCLNNFSPEFKVAKETGLLRVREGAEYLVEVEFDGGRQGKTFAFQPLIPLVFRW